MSIYFEGHVVDKYFLSTIINFQHLVGQKYNTGMLWLQSVLQRKAGV